ncbi:hypothetical protein [Chondrinema litorale]|uniref:hypothetical protein n=1 Tax=Chondrinema litorale TaxID=2994555 RepID=UPI002543BFF0|nr:hypothetical protein [Chondrinema litorale]UZR96367.1 hypothetical protein OQ292_22175 [Chondrinema litorale]
MSEKKSGKKSGKTYKKMKRTKVDITPKKSSEPMVFLPLDMLISKGSKKIRKKAMKTPNNSETTRFLMVGFGAGYSLFKIIGYLLY